MEGVRSSCDVILVALIFGDELSWEFGVAVVLMSCAAAVERVGGLLILLVTHISLAQYHSLSSVCLPLPFPLSIFFCHGTGTVDLGYFYVFGGPGRIPCCKDNR